MDVLLIIAHPRRNSFCHAIADRAISTLERTRHRVILHDLYSEKFDPILKEEESTTAGVAVESLFSSSGDPVIDAHRKDIAAAGGLLIIHPNWWGKPPANLCGWLDRVLVPGVAYRLQEAEGEPEGLLALQSALILNTSDTPQQREQQDLGDPLQLIWCNCVLPYCGAEKIERHMFAPVAGSQQSERERWLDDAEARVEHAFPPPAVMIR